jgi:protoheme IX farnesyltransferase
MRLRDWLELVKPERTAANVITAASGFILASRWKIDWPLFVWTMVGITLVISSACVANNIMDRRIDQKMGRAKQRSLVRGSVSVRSALWFAAALGVIGVVVLALYVNWLVVVLGLVAYLDYVVVYGALKRRSVYGALAGSISGSLSIVGGYVAVTGRIDTASVILFLILTFWQMPHFYAISIYRLSDYKSAAIPVLPARRGIMAAKREMIAYTLLFMIAASGLTIFGYTGVTYLVVVELLGLVWLGFEVAGLKSSDDVRWAKQMFKLSLVVNLILAIMIPAGVVLP